MLVHWPRLKSSKPSLQTSEIPDSALLSRDELSEHVRENTAVAVVTHFLRRVYSRDRLKRLLGSVGGTCANSYDLARLHCIRETIYVERLESREAMRCPSLTIHELEWNDSHPDEIRAVDSLE